MAPDLLDKRNNARFTEVKLRNDDAESLLEWAKLNRKEVIRRQQGLKTMRLNGTNAWHTICDRYKAHTRGESQDPLVEGGPKI